MKETCEQNVILQKSRGDHLHHNYLHCSTSRCIQVKLWINSPGPWILVQSLNSHVTLPSECCGLGREDCVVGFYLSMYQLRSVLNFVFILNWGWRENGYSCLHLEALVDVWPSPTVGIKVYRIIGLMDVLLVSLFGQRLWFVLPAPTLSSLLPLSLTVLLSLGI